MGDAPLRPDADPVRDGAGIPGVGLVRHEVVDLGRFPAHPLQQRPARAGHPLDGVLVDGAALHAEVRVLRRRWLPVRPGAGPAAGDGDQVVAGAVAAQVEREQLTGVAGVPGRHQGRARPVAEDDTGGAVVGVEPGRVDVGADQQDPPVEPRGDQPVAEG
ncbi:hypothetical protein SMICM17S_11201 [Streptomyces microflavus]